MAAQATTREQFYQQFQHYWNEGGFNRLFKTVQKVESEASTLRSQQIESLSKVIREANPIDVGQARVAAWGIFREKVRTLRAVEKELSPLYTLLSETYTGTLKDPTSYPGDHKSFSDQVDRIAQYVSKVYHDTMYPWMLSLSNADSGWTPDGILSRGLDYFYWWQTKNPKAEIEKIFPVERD